MAGMRIVAGIVLGWAIGCVALSAEEVQKSSVWSQLDVQVYGRLKADASYDSSRVDPGNYVRWVDRTGERDDEYNLTANETRLGLNIKGPDGGRIKTSGNIEFDFYGNSDTTDAENKAKPMMRRAYVLIDMPQGSLLAGQTADIVSPLTPRTLNYSVMWWVGNIGYRRPQIRFTKQMDLTKKAQLKLDVGISRTIGDTFMAESGEDFGPTAQARVGLTVPALVPKKPMTVGISGHWGKEEYYPGDTEVSTWSVNVDALIPMDEGVTLKAEWFMGKNLDAFLGGVGQGVNQALLQGIEAKGGWAAVEVEAGKGWSFTGGVGIDNPDTADLPAGGRDLNRCVFGNVLYAVNKNAKIGLELSQWRTEYKGANTPDDFRAQFSVIYEF